MAAVVYHVAGRANCAFYAKAERVGQILCSSLPSVNVITIARHPSEWQSYLKSLCITMGFNHEVSPIVYTDTGVLIGGADAFLKLVLEKYGYVVDLPFVLLNNIAGENLHMSTHHVTKRALLDKQVKHEEQWELRDKNILALNSIINQFNQKLDKCELFMQTLRTVKVMLHTILQTYTLLKDTPALCKYLSSFPLINLEVLTSLSDEKNLAKDLEGKNSSFQSVIDEFEHIFLVQQNVLKILAESCEKYQCEKDSLEQECVNFFNTLDGRYETHEKVFPPPDLVVENKDPNYVRDESDTTIEAHSSNENTEAPGLDSFASKPATPHSLPPKSPTAGSLKNSPRVKFTLQVRPEVNIFNDLLKRFSYLNVVMMDCYQTAIKYKLQVRKDIKCSTKTLEKLKNDVLHPTDFRWFKLSEKKMIRKDVCLLRFSLPRSDDVLNCPLGQYISIKPGSIENCTSSRAYSPITNNDQHKGYFEIVVKVGGGSTMMEYFSEILPGNVAAISGPAGNFIYEPNKYWKIGMIASGLGLMPMLQIIRKVAVSDTTAVSLIYYNTKEENFIFKEELDQLATICPRFQIYYITEKPNMQAQYSDCKVGILDESLFYQALPPINDNLHPIKVLVCGAPHIKEHTKILLTTMGYRSDQVHYF